jgi:hypothetical protein
MTEVTHNAARSALAFLAQLVRPFGMAVARA